MTSTNFIKLAASAAAVAVLGGCAELKENVTQLHTPERFRTVIEGTYDKARQAEMVDCVNDGLTRPRETALLTQVRQTQRANGVRVDIVTVDVQMVVAHVLNNGTFRVDRSDYNGSLKFDGQFAAMRDCLQRFKP